MKVYGWQNFRLECPPAPNGSRQTREIVAAPSAAAVMRLAGLSRSEWEHSGCETGNQVEIDIATARPGVVFWTPLIAGATPASEWTEATK